MKKIITGVVMSVLGLLGTIVLITIAALNPFNINGMDGLLVSLKGNDILFAFLCYLSLGAVGIIICIYESYFAK